MINCLLSFSGEGAHEESRFQFDRKQFVFIQFSIRQSRYILSRRQYYRIFYTGQTLDYSIESNFNHLSHYTLNIYYPETDSRICKITNSITRRWSYISSYSFYRKAINRWSKELVFVTVEAFLQTIPQVNLDNDQWYAGIVIAVAIENEFYKEIKSKKSCATSLIE